MPQSNEPIILTPQELNIAQTLARELAPQVDRNELGKVFDFFRRTRSKKQFFKLLKSLPRSGYVRSRQTQGYLRRIADGCEKHLKHVSDDERALAIVGWSFRLMTYYQTLKGQRYARNR